MRPARSQDAAEVSQSGHRCSWRCPRLESGFFVWPEGGEDRNGLDVCPRRIVELSSGRLEWWPAGPITPELGQEWLRAGEAPLA
eukprot:6245989-Amphidinium_carterae.1